MAVQDSFLLALSSTILTQSLPSCLSDSFMGAFGDRAVFRLTDADCAVEASQAGLFDSMLDNLLLQDDKSDHRKLVWLQEAAIDDALRTTEYKQQVDEFFRLLSGADNGYVPIDYEFLGTHSPGQQVLTFDSEGEHVVTLLHREPTFALLSLPSSAPAGQVLSYLPPYWKPRPLPANPQPLIPVPSDAIEHVRALLSNLAFDPVVASLVYDISVPHMRRDIRWLTGEDPASPIVTRHAFSGGARTAAKWLKERFEETGATCELREFLEGFAPNVVCKYPSTVNTTATVLISAHYDSRGSFGFQRAPGGDDDGSGTIALLSIARAIAKRSVTFQSNVELVAFAGEEQGLLGSKAYAQELRERNANITTMIQADMLGYHVASEPAQLGLPDVIGTREVADLVTKISAIYSPELRVGITPACCSDHQSFHQQGFPATQVFERAGPIADPMYHNSGDVSDRPGYDFEQIRSIAKVQFATLLHAAGYDVPSYENLD
ncbi:Zn-dependent exopeptidase [Coniophora puteana RWD-64-598 SS2]|uniref:Peptide hydrolase n=1 Tax=Coniophora puteana (strain RWD-64-598) TaxID=741705 RepID=A0A5M3MDI2_CONPW|nr:Zn-dependent exopeptidase [Coniophora puteana RWD-64-598 SS2]EIW77097.1 Zn-dependent exopeptidase [Coniophora puteana RWD-64-598 SS2]